MKGSFKKKKQFLELKQINRKEVNKIILKVYPCLLISIKTTENNDNKYFSMLHSISFFSMLANSILILSITFCLRKLTKSPVSLVGERGEGRQGCWRIVSKYARKQKANAADTQQISKESATVGLLLLEKRELMWHFKG